MAEMFFEFLERLDRQILSDENVYACQGFGTYQWYIEQDLDEMIEKAQATANVKKYPITIYRVSRGEDINPSESYLVVKRVIMSVVGDFMYEWVQVDTREAAELVRDVTHGATPFFGLVTETIVKPVLADEKVKK